MIGDLLKQVTKVAADISNGVINGATDVTEAITGKNAITRTVRRAGNGIVNETREFIEGIIDVGESALTGEYRDDDEPQDDHHAQDGENAQSDAER